MPTVADVTAVLKKLAPPQLAEDWDNTGLLIGRSEASVRKILTCLTLTSDVADEAVAQGVQLIVTHHPVLFRGTKKVTDAGTEGRILLTLIENGVAVYSPHTSFDSAELGINQQLAESFGLCDARPIRPCPENVQLGSGRFGRLKEAVSLPEFLKLVGSAVRAEYLEVSGDSAAKVSVVGVACGAAADFLADAARQGCDTFVTGEARFHLAIEARTMGINLILLGHFSSERPAVERLAAVLGEEFSEVDVFASRVEVDPLRVFVS